MNNAKFGFVVGCSFSRNFGLAPVSVSLSQSARHHAHSRITNFTYMVRT